MNAEETRFAKLVIDAISAEHPEYVLDVSEASDYCKIYLPDGYGANSAVVTIFHFGYRSKYFTMRKYALSKDDQKAVDAIGAPDKKGNISVSSPDDVVPYLEYLVRIAESQYKTYEIEKYREMSANRPKSELLDALGIGISINGSGIVIGSKNEQT